MMGRNHAGRSRHPSTACRLPQQHKTSSRTAAAEEDAIPLRRAIDRHQQLLRRWQFAAAGCAAISRVERQRKRHDAAAAAAMKPTTHKRRRLVGFIAAAAAAVALLVLLLRRRRALSSGGVLSTRWLRPVVERARDIGGFNGYQVSSFSF
jgi:hypothetical protein